MTPSDDELASAWLDGELDAAEQAAAEHDGDVRRAHEELAAVRRKLSEPVPVPAGLREQHIARALDELLGSGEGADDGVVALASRRPSPPPVSSSGRRSVPGTSWWMSRAAAAVLVLGGLGAGVIALADREAPDDDVAASSSVEESSAAGGAADATRAADVGEGEELEALTAPSGDDAPGAVPEEGAAPPEEVAATASVLVEASPGITAPDLATQLVERFGPVDQWPVAGAPAACARSYDERLPEGAPHVEVPLERGSGPTALIVPSHGTAVYVDPVTCEVVD